MYAVIETGGKQYRATPGEFLEIESIAGDIGSEVSFDKVLAVVDGDSVKAGSAVGSALVKGTIVANGRGEKTIVFKFKRKKQYRRTQGHRQSFTRIKVSEIA
ncbi:MAG TPA: 50S ribosomal protein L21 [Bryobacteraceae bacterium]|nr:50S ribosomal protein L21 [Bryobacteraceae bacterium]